MSNSTSTRSLLAGAIGGVAAFAIVVVVAALLMRRMMPRLMPAMMERMMAGEGCSGRMRECMEKCGCGPASAKGEAADQQAGPERGSVSGSA